MKLKINLDKHMKVGGKLFTPGYIPVLRIVFILVGAALVVPASAANDIGGAGGVRIEDNPYSAAYVISNPAVDTVPVKDRTGDFLTDKKANPFELKDPTVVTKEVKYDPETGMYILREKIGDLEMRPPTYMTFDEYMRWKAEEDDKAYYGALAGTGGKSAQLQLKKDPFEKFKVNKTLVDKLFGSNNMEIKPQGNVDLNFKLFFEHNENPLISPRFQNRYTPDFTQDIQLGVTGKIGDKIDLNANFNTSGTTFNFDDILKLKYNGGDQFSEDDIIQNIEAGNVSMPLKGSLIRGGQSLFGVKTELKFGHLHLTALASQKKSKQKSISLKSGAQIQQFEVRPDEYDENRHFFMSYYHRNSYETSLKNLPEVTSLVKIRNIEVWVTDNNIASTNTNVRDIVALSDLGTADTSKYHIQNKSLLLPAGATKKDLYGLPLPYNKANKLYDILTRNPGNRQRSNVVSFLQSEGLAQTRDFEKVRARKLTSSEYTYNPDLGFISLNVRPRPNQVVAISYEYTYRGKIYKVGELSSDIPSDSSYNVIFTKMLKSSGPLVNLPSWDLMMKNVYPLGTFGLTNEDFKLDIYYEAADGIDKRYIKELDGYPLINLFRMDNLNSTGDPQPDGIFDYVPGLTILPRIGSIIFPVLEPFGRSMDKLLEQVEPDPAKRQNIVDKYSYPELYNTTITQARQHLEKNKFIIKGEYKSSTSSEISLGAFNIPRGSVRVTAGGKTLTEENGDIAIDYNLGKVKILKDQYLQPGVNVNISLEDNTLFGFQLKTMLGLRAEYDINRHSNVGATYMHLFEQPYTRKVNIGDDPINNRIFGMDYNYSKEAPWLTRIVDKIPLISTKAKSQVAFQAEAAAIKPGHSKAIEQKGSDGGVVYIDDFEGVSSPIPLTFQANRWALASIPQGLPEYPESKLNDDWRIGSNRARLAWYTIQFGTRAANDNNSSYTRAIQQEELFPKRRRISTYSIAEERIFDITYFPRERGPYNFDIPNGYPGYSAGIDNQAQLNDPESRWAGLMRSISSTDFEEANIEYVDFWMMSPYLEKGDGSPVSKSGKMEIHLGTVSEDILKDSRQQYENGLPAGDLKLPTENTRWGRIARRPPLIANSFDVQKRNEQDLGLDGLDDSGENSYFADYLNNLRGFVNDNIYQNDIASDPANDNYVPFLDSRFGDADNSILRYKKYNNPQGNAEPERTTFSNVIQSSTNIPDKEDLNEDKSLNEAENYYVYEIPLVRDGDSLNRDQTPFITDVRETKGPGGTVEKWYRFRVPIHEFSKKVGQIEGFRSIQYMRMIFRDFNERTTFRFAKLDLTRNQWRTYEQDQCVIPLPKKDFTIDVVNIEENDKRFPFEYRSPPGIERERILSPYADVLQNEQSLVLSVTNLPDSCERSIYKIIDLDLRNFKQLKMYAHAHELNTDVIDGDLKLFIQLGKDFKNNYYEYEIPLSMSDPVNGTTDRENIWLEANNLDVALDAFVNLKKERNKSNFPITDIYEISDPNKPSNLLRIKGNPTLGIIRAIRVGIRNSKEERGEEDVEVWLNELRLTGLNERGGVAALAKLDVQLADFGTLSMAGAYTGVGFGGLDQKLAQRAQDELVQYDISTNLKLEKFFPKNLGLNLPMYAQYSNSFSTPLYDPNDNDVRLKDKLSIAQTKDERDSIRSAAIDAVEVKAVNFTNVKINPKKKSKKKYPWDIGNFSTSYAWSNTKKSNPLVREERVQTNTGALDYQYSVPAPYIKPFGKIVKSKYLKFISEFNFNPVPNSISITSELDRKASTRTYRFGHPKYSTWQNNNFNWSRDYNLKWDLAKSLKFTLNAVNLGVVDELLYNPLRVGYVDPRTDQVLDASQVKPYLLNNLKSLGRTKSYEQKVNLSYTLPFKYIPFMDWVTAKANYSGTYNWVGGSLRTIDSLGSVIQNGQDVQLTLDLRFNKLYSKSKYLKAIDRRPRYKSKRKSRSKSPKKKNAKPVAKKKSNRRKKRRDPSWAERIFIRPLLSLRTVKATYKQSEKTVVPGFLERSFLLGMDRQFNDPGWDFVSGVQPVLGSRQSPGWLDEVAGRGLLSNSVFQSQEVLQTRNRRFQGKLTVEPFYDLKLDVSLDWDKTLEHSELFVDTLSDGITQLEHLAPSERGSYKISFIGFNTLFKDYKQVFQQFDNNRLPVAIRLADQLGVTAPHDSLPLAQEGYRDGFGPNHNKVLALAFLSAYTDKDPNTTSLDLFSTMPLPNWNLTYNGLTKIEALKDVFSSFTIKHGYKSTLVVNSFETHFQYQTNDQGLPIAKNPQTYDFYPRYRIPTVVIDESFVPLFGLDIKTKTDFTFKMEMKKARNLSLEADYSRLNETRSTTYVLGVGYIFKDFDYKTFRFGKRNTSKKKKKKRKKKKKKGGVTNSLANLFGGEPKNGRDLEFSLDVSYKDNISEAHSFNENGIVEPFRGSTDITISPSLDYKFSDRLTYRLYWDYRKTIPHVSNQYNRTTWDAGLTIRFILK